MKVHRATFVVLLASITVSLASRAAEPPPTAAQQQAMLQAWDNAARVGPEHLRLAEQLAGTWTTRQHMWIDDKTPPAVSNGRSVHTPILGGRQIRFDFRGDIQGEPFEGTGLMGYDNVAGHYVGTWTDNTVTGIVVGTGRYDPATRTYTFHDVMSDPLHPGQQTTMRETLQAVDADHLVQEMFDAHDGREVRILRVEYTRER